MSEFRKDTEDHEGPKFIGYDNFEDAIEEMSLMSKQADLGTLQWQWDLLKPGTYAIRFVGDITIYTEILENYDSAEMKGYVFGRHYSVATFDNGELGDAHRAVFHSMITKEMFEAARENHWTPLRKFSKLEFIQQLELPFHALTGLEGIPTLSTIDYVDPQTNGMKGTHFNCYHPDGYSIGIPLLAVMAIIPNEMVIAAKAHSWDIMPRYAG